MFGERGRLPMHSPTMHVLKNECGVYERNDLLQKSWTPKPKQRSGKCLGKRPEQKGRAGKYLFHALTGQTDTMPRTSEHPPCFSEHFVSFGTGLLCFRVTSLCALLRSFSSFCLRPRFEGHSVFPRGQSSKHAGKIRPQPHIPSTQDPLSDCLRNRVWDVEHQGLWFGADEDMENWAWLGTDQRHWGRELVITQESQDLWRIGWILLNNFLP